MRGEADFWTRRKAKVLEEAEADSRIADAEDRTTTEARLAGKTDDELLEELGLPDPDTLQAGDDFKAFLIKAVPERLRRRALRRLWLSNPALANLDGLLDYGEDFTDSATVLENLQTAYQVGKGMSRHVDEMIRQAEQEDTPETAEDEAAPDEAVVEPMMAEAEPQPIHDEADPQVADEAPTPRRRMQFTFNDHAGDTA